MSFYIELKNWDENGERTFLVQSFNRASKVVKEAKGIFGVEKLGPDPDATSVVLELGGPQRPKIAVKIPMSYENFKKALLDAQAANRIPSFSAF